MLDILKVAMVRHREEKSSGFCQKSQRAPRLIIVLEMLMLMLMLTLTMS